MHEEGHSVSALAHTPIRYQNEDGYFLRLPDCRVDDIRADRRTTKTDIVTTNTIVAYRTREIETAPKTIDKNNNIKIVSNVYS